MRAERGVSAAEVRQGAATVEAGREVRVRSKDRRGGRVGRLFALLILAGGCATNRGDSRHATTGPGLETAVAVRLSGFRPVEPASVLALGTASSWCSGATASPRRTTELDRIAVDAEIRSLRGAMPDEQALEPLSEEVHRLLDAATTALNAGDHDSAAQLAENAVERSNGRAEPLEVLLVAELARGSVGSVPVVLREIRRSDPANPIAIASQGLEAAREGRFDEALGKLCWFIGSEALPRRGRAIPLPSSPGELAEQAALAALAVGRHELAAIAAESGLNEPRLAPASRWRLELVLVDALAASGRFADAGRRLAAMNRAEAARAVGPAGPLLVELRAARLFELVEGAGSDPVALWTAALQASGQAGSAAEEDGRFLQALCSLHRLGEPTREGVVAELRALADRVDAGRPSRAAVLSLAFDPGFGRACAQPPLARALIDDPPALLACMRLLHREDLARATELAVSLTDGSPEDIDRIVQALLLSGGGIDAILRAIERNHAGGVGDALRSRILAIAGEPERAYAVAETARSRDRASRAVLAAALLSAAALRDETLIDQLEVEVRAGGDVLARTVAAAWLAVGRMDRAAAAAERALRMEPDDDAAVLVREIVRLEGRETRSSAAERLREIAASRGAMSGAALAALRSHGLGADDDRTIPGRIEDSVRLLDESRSPFAVECLALACILEGAGALEPALAARASVPSAGGGSEVRRDGAGAIDSFLGALRDESPASPSRRIAAILAARRVPSGEPLPDAPLAARIDARVHADPEVLARARLVACALRPRTPAASAALADAALDAGDLELASQALARAASGVDGAIPPQAARSLLRASNRLLQRDPSRSTMGAREFIRFAERVEPAGVADLEAALEFAITAGLPVGDIVGLARRVSSSLRASGRPDAPLLSRMLERLVSIDGDPYLAGRVAAVVAAESQLDEGTRALLGRSAVALQAAAGVDPDDAIDLVRDLAARGIELFEPTVGPWSLAEALRRAAGVFAMVGDERGAERLLLASLAEDAASARSMNDLAYLRAERGELADGTVAMAESAAAALPDDPSILDTLGFIRYLERRLRDGVDGAGAVTLLRQALRLRPEEPSIATLDHLGDALWRDGDQSGAVRCWQEVGRVARLRHPPEATRAAIAAFQLREYGVVVADPAEVARRQFGRTVERAERKLRDVAEGRTPAVAERPVGGSGTGE